MDFGAAWPVASAQISAVLRARGVQAPDIDDVAQEVALRALRAADQFESDDHFVAWCCRVAINLHIDATRRQQRFSPASPPDVVGRQDTAATVERRMALDVLAERIAELPEEDRRLLFDPAQTDSRRDAVRLAVRRHRLRARLALLVEGLLGALALVRRLRFPRQLSTPVKVSLAAAPLVAAGLVLGPFTTGSPSTGRREVDPSAIGEAAGPPAAPGTVPTAHRAPGPAAPVLTRAGAVAPKPPAIAGANRSTVIVGATPGGVPVRLTKDEHPVSSGQLVCTGGIVGACIPKPSPVVLPVIPSGG